MELTEKQKKDLNGFSLILNSLNMEDGVEWYYRYYGEWEDDEPNGPHYNNRDVGIGRERQVLASLFPGDAGLKPLLVNRPGAVMQLGLGVRESVAGFPGEQAL